MTIANAVLRDTDTRSRAAPEGLFELEVGPPAGLAVALALEVGTLEPCRPLVPLVGGLLPLGFA